MSDPVTYYQGGAEGYITYEPRPPRIRHVTRSLYGLGVASRHVRSLSGPAPTRTSYVSPRIAGADTHRMGHIGADDPLIVALPREPQPTSSL